MDWLPEITILGHRGGYLSLIFENLASLHFQGKVNIVLNEKGKKDLSPFKTNIPYTEIYYTEFKPSSKNAFIFCANTPVTKKFLFHFYEELWKIKTTDFVQSIHPSSVIASSAVLNSGVQIGPLCIVDPYSSLGFGVNIGRNSSVGHHVILRDYSSIHFGTNVAGGVEIGEGTLVGPGCTVFNDVKIGNNTIIGGGSIVTKDIPSNVLAYGNPCKIIKELN